MAGKKRVILLGDGMPDHPIDSLGGKTVLMAAKTPNMDKMAGEGSVGYVNTVPNGFEPGSDVTNMGLLGYDPKKYYTGRSPLEAAGMHIEMKKSDVAFRCNLVTLAAGPEGLLMEEFTAGHITSEEALELITALNRYFGGKEFLFHPGVSYRHLMIWKNGIDDIGCTPPHDIIGKNVQPYLPGTNGKADAGKQLWHLTGEAQIVLKNHPVNVKRKKDGKPMANSIWLWGEGKAPKMPTLKELRGITGAMISAVDLMRGIAELAGMKVINVEGATGYIDTNYEGKAKAAINALKEVDLVYLHVESPDESGHEGSLKNKTQAIEDFDAKIVGPLLEEMKRIDGMAIVLSDHATPTALMTHTTDPVPFAVWPAFDDGLAGKSFDESIISDKNQHFGEGYLLFERFLK